MPGPFDADTSVYANVGRGGEGNLLGPLSSAVGIMRGLNENQLFQQTFRARAAMGPIIQKNIDPATGQPNWYKTAVDMATNPDTAFMASEFMNQLQQRELIQTEIMKNHIDIANKKQEALGAAYNAVANEKGEVNEGNLLGHLSTILPSGLFDLKEMIAHLAQARAQGYLKNEDTIRNYARTMAAGSQRGSTLLSMNEYRPDLFTDMNGNKYGGWINNLQHSVAVPGGEAGPTSLGTATRSMTSPPAAAGSPGARGDVGPTGIPGTSGSTSPSVLGPPPGLTMGSPGPMRQKMLDDVGKYKDDVDNRAQQANNLNALFSQAQRYLKDFKPGGGTQLRADMAQIAQGLGMPNEFVDKISKGDLGSVQAARKLFFGIGAQIATQLIHAGGGRLTQTEWARTLLEGSPNIDLDERAIRKIISSMKELANYSLMEKDYFYHKMQNSRATGYDMTNVQGDWQNMLGRAIEDREGGR